LLHGPKESGSPVVTRLHWKVVVLSFVAWNVIVAAVPFVGEDGTPLSIATTGTGGVRVTGVEAPFAIATAFS